MPEDKEMEEREELISFISRSPKKMREEIKVEWSTADRKALTKNIIAAYGLFVIGTEEKCGPIPIDEVRQVFVSDLTTSTGISDEKISKIFEMRSAEHLSLMECVQINAICRSSDLIAFGEYVDKPLFD